MSLRGTALFAGAAVIFNVMLTMSGPAQALSMAECSTKYQDAKKAGTLGGLNWASFRKQNCASDAPAAGQPAATQTPPPATSPTTAPVSGGATSASSTTSDTGRQAATARERQCGSEWRANTEALKKQYGSWPKYWSACNTRIKTTGK